MDIQALQDTPPWEWPEDVGKTFLKFLIDRRASESDRLIAAELAGDYVVINDELAEALLAIVTNPGETEELRAKAVISFGPALETVDTDGYEDPDDLPPIAEDMFQKIQDALRDLYRDASTPKLLRRRILEASVRAPEPWHNDAIRDAYATGDSEWMLTAVFAMAHVRGFDEQILDALDNPDPDIQLEAVEAAGNWGIAGAWDAVVELVNDEDTPKGLRLAAIEAIGSIRPSEARMILVELADSDDEDIAEAADEGLLMADAASEGDDEEDYEYDEDEEDDEEELIN